MIRIILTIVIFLMSLILFAQNKKTSKTAINVTLNNIVSDKGYVKFSLYQENGFLETPIQSVKEKMQKRK